MNGHGGNIYAASIRTGLPLNRILDFSASINPLGVPAKAARVIQQHITLLPHYPEPYSDRLTEYLGGFHDIHPESVICGNGSTELIYLVPRALRPKKVLIPAPTFSEYERACRAAGRVEIHHYLLREKNFDIDTDEFIREIERMFRNEQRTREQFTVRGMIFVCNPNNPTGRVVKKRDLLKIAEAAKRMKCVLVVDEAFIDFCPAESIIKEVRSNPYVIVLRSLTKFYALAGLRIGYGIIHPELSRIIKKFKEPWTVNSLVHDAVVAVLEDKKYEQISHNTVSRQKVLLQKKFRSMGVTVIPSRANYFLLKHSRAQDIINGLEREGILVRDCSNYAGLDDQYFRVAVRSGTENMILLNAVNRIMNTLGR